LRFITENDLSGGGKMERTVILLSLMLLSMAVFSSSGAGEDVAPEAAICCDINGDGKTGLEEAIYALQVVATLKPSTCQASTIDDFAFIWAGSITDQMADGSSQTMQIQLILHVSGNSLVGTLVEEGQSDLDIAGTFLNGIFTFALPTVTPADPDCANWNVTVTATLNENQTSMNIDGSGTFCSSGGGQAGTYSGVLTKQVAYGYVPNFGKNSVAVIDMATYTVVANINVGTIPAGLVEINGRIYVADMIDGTVNVIDINNYSIIDTIDLGHPVADLAVNADTLRIYVLETNNGTTVSRNHSEKSLNLHQIKPIWPFEEVIKTDLS
jgi:YVTN family beta-propeller protein